MKKGFTLIELLIVIAIIAILALIAVPNFLEAQTRAKVTRVTAEMRSLAVAVEAYSVDWGRPPNCYFDWTRAPECLGGTTRPGGDRNSLAQVALTTPVAYMTSILRDYFQERGGTRASTGKSHGNYEPLKFYTYMCQDWINTHVVYARAARMGYIWQTRSFGPSRTLYPDEWPAKTLVGGYPAFAYDASNGTISQGHLVRTNKGHFGGTPGT